MYLMLYLLIGTLTNKKVERHHPIPFKYLFFFLLFPLQASDNGNLFVPKIRLTPSGEAIVKEIERKLTFDSFLKRNFMSSTSRDELS